MAWDRDRHREKPLEKQERSHLGRKTAHEINQTRPVFPGILPAQVDTQSKDQEVNQTWMLPGKFRSLRAEPLDF